VTPSGSSNYLPALHSRYTSQGQQAVLLHFGLPEVPDVSVGRTASLFATAVLKAWFPLNRCTDFTLQAQARAPSSHACSDLRKSQLGVS
jgi:hypothetical protein